MESESAWWKTCVIYQIYPRSFRDSNGDGIGDLNGVTSALDYLQWLGIDAIWLNPTYPSPNTDFGYDISDYYGVHPEFGTVEDMERLIEEAGKVGIKVILDLVPNHTSDQHPWFLDALTGPTAKHRAWYVFADGKYGGPPNNWLDVIDECAWVHEPTSNQWYLHNFLPTQPDLNWWNDDVHQEFQKILRYWFDRGVAGFRIDVAHGVVKDAQLRDNPPAPPKEAGSLAHHTKQIQLYNAHQPEVHPIYRIWRQIAASYAPERLLYGETYALSTEETASYYGDEDEFQITLNGPSIGTEGTVAALSAIVRESEETFPSTAWPSWTGSNHDQSRFPTRWAHGSERLARCFLLMLLSLRGTPVVYYGDELAMEDVEIDPALWKDPMFIPGTPSRDRARTPMTWKNTPGGGFTAADVTPWLPFGDLARCNVEDERDTPNSSLNFAKRLLTFRKEHPDFALGDYRELLATESVWVWSRGTSYRVVLNLGADPAELAQPAGTILCATDAAFEQSLWDGRFIPAQTACIVTP